MRRAGPGAAAILAALTACAVQAQEVCRDDRVDLRGDWGQARFTVAVADSPEEQARGLMFVESMPATAGMLFAYDSPRAVSFWMRNTLIPLDMLFIGPRGVVRRVHAEAVPGDETPIPGGEGVQFVLEINGGLAERLGIGPGDEVRHPLIDADPAWPCGAAEGG